MPLEFISQLLPNGLCWYFVSYPLQPYAHCRYRFIPPFLTCFHFYLKSSVLGLCTIMRKSEKIKCLWFLSPLHKTLFLDRNKNDEYSYDMDPNQQSNIQNDQLISPPLSSNISAKQTKLTSKWSLAVLISIAIFIINNFLVVFSLIYACRILCNAPEMGSLILIPIFGLAFLYITVIVPLWIFLIIKLRKRSIMASALSIVIQPYLIIQLLNEAYNFTPKLPKIVTSLELVIIYTFIGAAFYVYIKEFLNNRRLNQESKIRTQETLQKPQVAAESSTSQLKTNKTKGNIVSAIFNILAAAVNYYVLNIWYSIIILPFVYITEMSGYSYPYYVHVSNLYIPQFYLVLLIEIPIVSLITFYCFKKRLHETYLHTLLFFI